MSQRALGRPGRISILTFTDATTEESFDLPLGGRGFELFARSAANIRWSYTEGTTLQANGAFRTIPQGEAGGETGILVRPQPIEGRPDGTTAPVTVYVSVSAATIVEVSVYDGA